MQPLNIRLLLESCQHAHPWLDGIVCAADAMLKQLRMCWLADHLHAMTVVKEASRGKDIVSPPLHPCVRAQRLTKPA